MLNGLKEQNRWWRAPPIPPNGKRDFASPTPRNVKGMHKTVLTWISLRLCLWATAKATDKSIRSLFDLTVFCSVLHTRERRAAEALGLSNQVQGQREQAEFLLSACGHAGFCAA